MTDPAARTDLLEQMVAAPLFSALPEPDRLAVLDHASLVEVPTAAAVVREEAAGADCVALLSGKLTVSLLHAEPTRSCVLPSRERRRAR